MNLKAAFPVTGPKLEDRPDQTYLGGLLHNMTACLLKPAVMQECDRLFDIALDVHYLQRINKLDRLPDWQLLADKVITQVDSTEK